MSIEALEAYATFHNDHDVRRQLHAYEHFNGEYERRPCARVMKFLAESKDGLDKLIHDNTQDKTVVSIKTQKKEGILFGAWTAEVRYLPNY